MRLCYISISLTFCNSFNTENGETERARNLSTLQFAPFLLYQRGAIDSLTRGLFQENSRQFDQFFDEQVHNSMV